MTKVPLTDKLAKGTPTDSPHNLLGGFTRPRSQILAHSLHCSLGQGHHFSNALTLTLIPFFFLHMDTIIKLE